MNEQKNYGLKLVRKERNVYHKLIVLLILASSVVTQGHDLMK